MKLIYSIGLLLSAGVGLLCWHFIELTRAGVIGVTEGFGSGAGESPEVAYGTGLVVGIVIGAVCLIGLLIPERWARRLVLKNRTRRPSGDEPRPARRTRTSLPVRRKRSTSPATRGRGNRSR